MQRSSKLAKSANSTRHDDLLAWALAPSTIATAPRWPDFASFAMQCRTRQRGGIKGLDLYPWQRDFAELIERRSVILAKSRQTGSSGCALLYMLWQCLSKPGFMGLIVSKSFADAQLLARRVRRAVAGLGITPDNDSLALMAFPNDSTLIFRSIEPTENVGRGIDCLDFLLLDEASFYDDLGEALKSLGPALSSSADGRMCLISTPNGRSGGYWDRLVGGIGETEFETALSRCRGSEKAYEIIEPNEGLAKLIVHWRAIPAYRNEPDFLGRIRKEFALSQTDLAQEYNLNFEQSSQNVFDFALIKKASGSNPNDIDHNAVYFGGLDCASTGKDNTVFILLRRYTNEVDGIESCYYAVEKMYRKKSGTSEQHMGAISDIIQDYDPIGTTIETNSIGALYLERLASVNTQQPIEGFTTTKQTKALLIGKITLALERGEIRFPSGPIEQELLSFRRNGEKLEAAPNSHDDCVMALGLALHAAKYGIKESNILRG